LLRNQLRIETSARNMGKMMTSANGSQSWTNHDIRKSSAPGRWSAYANLLQVFRRIISSRSAARNRGESRSRAMIKFLLWCILLVLCWPLVLLALVLYPIVWLALLPFRFVGIVVTGVLDLVWAIVMLPALLIRKLAAN